MDFPEFSRPTSEESFGNFVFLTDGNQFLEFLYF